VRPLGGLGVCLIVGVAGCRSAAPSRVAPEAAHPWGSVEGVGVSLYTLRNARGVFAKVSDYGATLTELWVPDRNGSVGNVVLGFDRLDQYVAATFYMGAVLGRVANRIANGRFTLEAREYTLATNRPPNHLHGGLKGFDKCVWWVS
jgi:aldose 1-epimerase